MGFRNGSYAKCWKIENKTPTWTKVQLSTSRKDKETGEYETDFSGFVDFYGTACVQKISRHKDGDRIILRDVDVTTKYDKGKEVTYTNFKCYSFDEVDEGGSGKTESKPKKKTVDDGEVESPEESSEDYPF